MVVRRSLFQGLGNSTTVMKLSTRTTKLMPGPDQAELFKFDVGISLISWLAGLPWVIPQPLFFWKHLYLVLTHPNKLLPLDFGKHVTEITNRKGCQEG